MREGRRGRGRQRARQDTKRRERDVNRSDRKMQTKGLMESGKNAEERKREVLVNR